MEFIPRSAPATSVAPLADARQRLIREIGVAAVAAALGIADDAPVPLSIHAHAEPRTPMPQKAA